MATSDELLNNAIETAIQAPQSVSVDGQSINERPVDDLLKLEKALSARKSRRSNGFGISFVPVEFPGSQR
jgi:hypothetical protein